MIEPVADALARRLLLVAPAGPPRGRDDLDRLPPPVGHLLAVVLDRRVAHEAVLPRSAWFDDEAGSVRAAARAWREATRQAAQFPADAWPDALHAAALQALRHLVEPVETLAAFAFDDEDGPLAVATVRARLAAFAPYPYLRDIAEGYFERKGLDRMEREDLVRLLRKIDERMVAGYGPTEWMSLLAPLFALVRTAPEHAAGVPGGLLQRFFAAKGRDDLASRLDEGEVYDEATLRAALREALGDDAPPEPPAAGAPPPPSSAALEEPDEERWDEAEVERKVLPSGEGAAIIDADAGDGERPPRPLRAAAPSRSSEPLVRLETRVLGFDATERRDWYVAHLTGGSEAVYRRVLERLDRAASWDEAQGIIAAEVFKPYGVAIYDAPAIAFTDGVEARFKERR